MTGGLQMTEQAIYADLLGRYPALKECGEQIWAAYEVIRTAYVNAGILYVAGNGGSAADSEHIVGELMKSFMLKRAIDNKTRLELQRLYGEPGLELGDRLEGGLPAVSLPSLVSLSTAVSNDVTGEMIFAQPLNAIGRRGDGCIGISSSGNSANVGKAMIVAKAKGMYGIGMTGKKQNRLDELCDVVIHVPETETYKIQELHLPVYHALCAMLEAHYFGLQ